MIYELALIMDASVNDEKATSITDVVKEVVEEAKGEVLVSDDWGTINFAQPFAKGVKKGRYLYFIFKSETDVNNELLRRFKIDEAVVRSMVFRLGPEAKQAEIVKKYKTPFSKKYNGSVLDEVNEEGRSDVDKDRKNFVRRKTCWFTAKSIHADWKDPATFIWLVNEFGKISPARITGITRKHQTCATMAIKRARQMGIVDHMSNAVAQ